MQLSYKLLSYCGESQRPRVTYTNEKAPERPNTFSDGSLKHPGSSLALGTFGTWEPTRDYAATQPEEHDFCMPLGLTSQHRLDGLLMAGTLGGVFNCSTRTEPAGVISCLPKPGGLHIALDNESVVDRGNEILNGAFSSRKPWGLLTDGDLWQTFADAITLRGAHSVKLSWTKGHSSWQRIAASVANPENAYAHSNIVGNSIADAAADKGHEAVGQADRQRVLDYFASKQQAYRGLIERLQKFAAALLLHDRECHREAGIGAKSKNLVTFIHAPPVTPRRSLHDGDSLSLHPLPPDMINSHWGLHVFWDCTRWDLSSETSRPTTWIELFALYRLWGGGEQEEGPHARKPRLAALIKSFIQQSKHLLRTCGNGESELFTSA